MNDFVESYKDKLNYYYFDRYNLQQEHYDHAISYNTSLFKNVIEDKNIDQSVSSILKLKMLAHELSETDWIFPIVIYKNFITCGSGRVFIDKFLFNRENKKTILIEDFILNQKNKRVESIFELSSLINVPNFYFYTENGLILSMDFKNMKQSGFTKQKNFYFKNYKNLLISDIKKIDPNNLDFILRFIEKKEDFFL
jgi:hypothetical protein